MTAISVQISLLKQVRLAWSQAGLRVSIGAEDGRRITAVVEKAGIATALEVAVRALEASGCRTCWEHKPYGWSLFAFFEAGALSIDLSDGGKHRLSRWRALNGCVVPTVALLGPDGVGKSTALRLVREWFEREAPFVAVTVRQWRPALFPSLASVMGKPEDTSGATRPRRTPGKGHWIRLFYYFLDFLVGSWWKDRNRDHCSRLIVYDRCALDMWVDPCRFALKSRSGTWALWKLTPRPQTMILLYDSADRIARRKDDLQEHEVAEQLESWLELAAADEVHAIIRVNDGPEEIARRIRDLFIETFIRRHEHSLARGNSQVLTALSGAGRQYAVVPSAASPRFLLPLDGRAATAASLSVYNAQRPAARIAKSLLTLGLRAGIAQRFLRDRIELADGSLRDFLGHLLGHADLSIAYSLGTAGPNQKPVLQIMNRYGRVLAYGKIGWNERTIASVRNEAEALARLEQTRFTTAVVPRVLDAGWIREQYVLIQSPAASRLSKVPGLDDRHLRFLAELHLLEPANAPLPRPSETMICQLRRGGLHYFAHLLDRVRNGYSFHRGIPCGLGHGDFTAWNIRSAGDKLLVFDWETFGTRVPAGWDLFHMIVAGEVEIRDATPASVYAAIMEPGRTRDQIEKYFGAIGASRDFIEPLLVSYAAHALGTSLLGLGDDANEKDRALQRTWAAILAVACNRSGAVVHSSRQALEEAV